MGNFKIPIHLTFESNKSDNYQVFITMTLTIKVLAQAIPPVRSLSNSMQVLNLTHLFRCPKSVSKYKCGIHF
jgi:hypothetical protein